MTIFFRSRYPGDENPVTIRNASAAPAKMPAAPAKKVTAKKTAAKKSSAKKTARRR
jgi:hypothetical protein